MSPSKIFLSLLLCFHHAMTVPRTCIPNTNFFVNDRICTCDSIGRWNEANCKQINQRHTCESGQIIWEGCNQCICQDNGRVECTHLGCVDDTTESASPILRQDVSTISPWCTPYKSYYVDCHICICPASGLTARSHCARDKFCKIDPSSSLDILTQDKTNICIPNVTYLFPCLQCICSQGGYFILDKCVDTCSNHQQIDLPRRCISRTFYRRDCNVCWCPEDSIADDRYCTHDICNKRSKFRSLDNLRKRSTECTPNSFTQPKCYYCECTDGTINENACLDLNCLRIDDYKYDVVKEACSPGEMVPVCEQCLCLRDGKTKTNFCTKLCSHRSKLDILKKVLNKSFKNNIFLDRDIIRSNNVNEFCQPNSIFVVQDMFCICPENGNTSYKICIPMPEEIPTKDPVKTVKPDSLLNKRGNYKCEPNTFVEVDCNTCYCSKNGTIDPNWCTYDDCESKRIILENHRTSTLQTTPKLNDHCTPGSISKADCNFCICPDNTKSNENVCTKNVCSQVEEKTSQEVFTCEPLAYYLVDCNICFCPADGLKNVEKCTKNVCEKGFLRTHACIPGQLFSDDCNVCICPPNGDKSDRICTNHTCSDWDTPWKRIFKISQNLLINQDIEDTTRKLDVCFPGEEFVVDCKVCVCPDMGLRAYATCTPMLCNEEKDHKYYEHEYPFDNLDRVNDDNHIRSRRKGDDCMSFNLTDSSERKECTPGSLYIIRCRQCICPYMGNINDFCRPLPEGIYCEQAYPLINYVPMGRRQDGDNSTGVPTDDSTATNSTEVSKAYNTTEVTTTGHSAEVPTANNSTKTAREATAVPIPMNHKHTKHKCERPGRIMDICFICECEEGVVENVIIEEHCFKSESEKCTNEEPTFLKQYAFEE